MGISSENKPRYDDGKITKGSNRNIDDKIELDGLKKLSEENREILEEVCKRENEVNKIESLKNMLEYEEREKESVKKNNIGRKNSNNFDKINNWLESIEEIVNLPKEIKPEKNNKKAPLTLEEIIEPKNNQNETEKQEDVIENKKKLEEKIQEFRKKIASKTIQKAFRNHYKMSAKSIIKNNPNIFNTGDYQTDHMKNILQKYYNINIDSFTKFYNTISSPRHGGERASINGNKEKCFKLYKEAAAFVLSEEAKIDKNLLGANGELKSCEKTINIKICKNPTGISQKCKLKVGNRKYYLKQLFKGEEDIYLTARRILPFYSKILSDRYLIANKASGEVNSQIDIASCNKKTRIGNEILNIINFQRDNGNNRRDNNTVIETTEEKYFVAIDSFSSRETISFLYKSLEDKYIYNPFVFIHLYIRLQKIKRLDFMLKNLSLGYEMLVRNVPEYNVRNFFNKAIITKDLYGKFYVENAKNYTVFEINKILRRLKNSIKNIRDNRNNTELSEKVIMDICKLSSASNVLNIIAEQEIISIDGRILKLECPEGFVVTKALKKLNTVLANMVNNCKLFDEVNKYLNNKYANKEACVKEAVKILKNRGLDSIIVPEEERDSKKLNEKENTLVLPRKLVNDKYIILGRMEKSQKEFEEKYSKYIAPLQSSVF